MPVLEIIIIAIGVILVGLVVYLLYISSKKGRRK